MNGKKPISNNPPKKIQEEDILNTEQFFDKTVTTLQNTVSVLEDQNRKLKVEALAYKRGFEATKFEINELRGKIKVNESELDKVKTRDIDKKANREAISKKLDCLYKLKDVNREADILKKADELYDKIMKEI